MHWGGDGRVCEVVLSGDVRIFLVVVEPLPRKHTTTHTHKQTYTHTHTTQPPAIQQNFTQPVILTTTQKGTGTDLWSICRLESGEAAIEPIFRVVRARFRILRDAHHPLPQQLIRRLQRHNHLCYRHLLAHNSILQNFRWLSRKKKCHPILDKIIISLCRKMSSNSPEPTKPTVIPRQNSSKKRKDQTFSFTANNCPKHSSRIYRPRSHTDKIVFFTQKMDFVEVVLRRDTFFSQDGTSSAATSPNVGEKETSRKIISLAATVEAKKDRSSQYFRKDRKKKR